MGFGDKSKKEKAAEVAAAANAKKAAANEDAGWEENDKGAKKKLDRAAQEAGKADEKLKKAQEKKELEAADEAMFDGGKKGKKDKNAGKLTQAQVQRNLLLANLAAEAKPKKTKKTEVVDNSAIVDAPNMNKVVDIDASGVEEALKALELNASKDDGKVSKMTYKQFEEEVIDKVKLENPGLKRNQLQEKCWKLWERSPLNPKNVVEK